MKKAVNLLSLTTIYNTTACFEKYKNFCEISLKADELLDIAKLVKELLIKGAKPAFLDHMFLGYTIPQISKEFDILRVGFNYTINIELKKQSTAEKIKKQLKQNRYYLSHFSEIVYFISYDTRTNTIYQLDKNEQIIIITFDDLLALIAEQEINRDCILDNLFCPTDYLVSPFNSTKKFLKGEYFLTNHQRSVKREFFKITAQSTQSSFFSITGKAGTGKTLLAYDIIKKARKNTRALIIHCGKLNSGHNSLINQGWEISSIKHYHNHSFGDYGVILIDEAQRIKPVQLESIISRIMSNPIACIYSLDQNQTLSSRETFANISEKINAINGIKSYNLSTKIRTNKELSTFITRLMNKKNNKGTYPPSLYNNIEILFFSSIETALTYTQSDKSKTWEYIYFTTSQYNKEYKDSYSKSYSTNSHDVIGQEFDNVAVIIDDFFSYDSNGELTYNAKSYYNMEKMLFQNLTRTRKKLKVIIINNQEVFLRCLDILTP